MIKNYLRVTLRTFQKNKSYFIINSLGLGIALACCITAYMLMAFNIEFDNFHEDEKVSRIYRVHTLSVDKDNNTNRDFAAPMILAPTAAGEISGVENFARYISGSGTLRRGDETFNESIAFADSTFFDLFDFPLLSGSHKSFKNKNSIFLSEDLAKKYFGDEDPTGRTLVF
jgi:putative ABC transport system permease protein